MNKLVNEAFATNWVAPLGPNVNGFEQDLESYLGNEAKVVALASGTRVALGINYGGGITW